MTDTPKLEDLTGLACRHGEETTLSIAIGVAGFGVLTAICCAVFFRIGVFQ